MSNVRDVFIYIDNSVLKKHNYSFKSNSFKSLKNHLNSGTIQSITNSIHQLEIKKHIGEQISKELKSVKKMKSYPVLSSIGVVEVSSGFIDCSHPDLVEMKLKEFNDFFDSKTLKYGSLDGDEVTELFIDRKAPFSSQKADEFKDVFQLKSIENFISEAISTQLTIFPELKNEVEQPIVAIITKDNGMRDYVERSNLISHVFEDIPNFLDYYIKTLFGVDHFAKYEYYARKLSEKNDHWLDENFIFDEYVFLDDFEAEVICTSLIDCDIEEINLQGFDEEYGKFIEYSIEVSGSIEVDVNKPEFRIWDPEAKEYQYSGSEDFSEEVSFECTYTLTLYTSDGGISFENYDVEIDEIFCDDIVISWDD
ncbi:hypothetical protein M902_0730 [Bacteriovorax sp. BAL6_X]|uniref:PIN domain-containing protein n=1 Tax=Bacteriovorax sp. BAL6_X TaxID=1201290 RepID=UPI00038583DF|nr:PIN domain-containing protein [Bacteriovorax sp. BAL6_X]EPZ49968.1 hypothetical protein M902_0730 [Bacteriovorax sp. BAL6_X]